tara:strand:+ start:34586 stop:36853 length:2268 start_codon:yes stop_codon:yes gene_type:complete
MEPEEEKKENKKEGMSWLEKLQLSLDAAGMVPGYGEFADLANAAIYGMQGDWKNAGISAAAMIPVVGSTGTAARLAYKGSKVAADALPVVSRVKTANRLSKKGVDYAMPPSVQKKWVKKSKPKPVQSTNTPDPTKKSVKDFAKGVGSKVNPKNWSTPMKLGVLLGGGYAGYETFFGGDDTKPKITDMPGFSNDNKEVPKSTIKRNAAGELEYIQEEEKEMGMGGIVQHDGGVQKPITERMSEYVGKSHAEGGIKLQQLQTGGQKIEVEGGEMEYSDMPMSDGSSSDYIFSDKLKYGGRTFADTAKVMAEEGGSEKQIMTLAKMQEAAAKNKGEAGRDPNMIMEEGGAKPPYGGLKKMVNGGPERKNLGNEGIATMQPGLGGGYFGSSDANMISEEEERKDFFNRNKSILKDLGIHSYQDYNPSKHAEMFQKKVNTHYKQNFENNEELRTELAGKGITDADAYIKSVGFEGKGARGIDGDHGEYTNSITTEVAKPAEDKVINQDAGVSQSSNDTGTGGGTSAGGTPEEEATPTFEAPDNTIGDLANMAAVGMALRDKPDYMKNPELVKPGVVVAGREAKVNMDRVDNSDLLARNASDANALNKAIETSGGGSSNIANKIAAFAKKKQADREIKSDQNRTNAQISNQETIKNAEIGARNVSNALSASDTNARNILAADTTNTQNKMVVDEFNRGADAATFDRKLNAVETAAANINQIYRDKAQYASNERVAQAQSGKTGIYERELMTSLLNKLNNNG